MKRLALMCMSILVLAACGGDDEEGNNANNNTDRAATIAALTGVAADAQTNYTQVCVTCHGVDGTGVDGLGNDLTASSYTKEQTIDIILNGTTGVTPAMSAYGSTFNDQEIADLTQYSLDLQSN